MLTYGVNSFLYFTNCCSLVCLAKLTAHDFSGFAIAIVPVFFSGGHDFILDSSIFRSDV